MSIISVSLSAIETCGREISVCVAKQSLGVIGKNASLEERFINDMSKTCLEMAKEVSIDTRRGIVFIGVDPKDNKTALVDYVSRADKNSIRFFDIFERNRVMLFEYQVYGVNNDVLFVVKGLWVEDRWYAIEVYPSPSITVEVEKE